MPDKVPVEWCASLESVAKKLDIALLGRESISFKGVELVRDLGRNIVYELNIRWVGNNPQREIINGFWHNTPFFTANNLTNRLGEIWWAKEKPYGINRSRRVVLEYGDEDSGATILTMTGEYPHLRYHTAKKICWGISPSQSEREEIELHFGRT